MGSPRAETIRNGLPDAQLTVSSTIGRMGLLKRENAATHNASLADLSREVVDPFQSALPSRGLDAPPFISQNDGTLLSDAFVVRYPVLTFASGPTNSTRARRFSRASGTGRWSTSAPAGSEAAIAGEDPMKTIDERRSSDQDAESTSYQKQSHLILA